MADFKDMLAYYRKRDNLSQRELAKKIGVSASTIGMYESGKRFPEREIEEALADLFNVSLNALRGIDEETNVSLSISEEELIKAWRNADEETRGMIMRILAYDKTRDN